MTQRGDLAAAVGVVVFLAELIFAQCTLALVLWLVIAGKLSRWRPLWLVTPAAAGLAWMLAIGVRPAVAGYLACGGHVLNLVAHGTLAAKARGFSDLLANWRLWLPGQVPIALIAAAAQAALLALLPGPLAARRPYRPGALVAVRSIYLTATLRRGELATCDGCCLGIETGTGKPAAVSWQEAEAGVLCASQDEAAVSTTGRDLVLAAIQHRKTVVVIDLASDVEYTRAEGKSGASVAEEFESECTALGAPFSRFDWRNSRYDPLTTAKPARATSLTMATIDWTGIAHARQLFCANYLNAAFTVLAASQAQWRAGTADVLDELVKLMTPGALHARLVQARGSQQAAGPLVAQVAELSAQLDADRSILGPAVAQLAELNSAVQAGLWRPSAGGFGRSAQRASTGDHAAITLATALADRAVVLFPLRRLALDRPARMIARLAVADLIENLAERSDLGSRTDCLVWINGCEAIDPRQLAVLVALGERTGAAVVLGTALGAAAARLAADVNVIAVRGVSPAQLAGGAGHAGQAGQAAGQAASRPIGLADSRREQLADVLTTLHAPGCREALSFGVLRPRPRLVAGCKVVR